MERESGRDEQETILLLVVIKSNVAQFYLNICIRYLSYCRLREASSRTIYSKDCFIRKTEVIELYWNYFITWAPAAKITSRQDNFVSWRPWLPGISVRLWRHIHCSLWTKLFPFSHGLPCLGLPGRGGSWRLEFLITAVW